MNPEPLLIPAGNPSEWTGPTGTNTWLLRGRTPTLIDAGVGLPDHVEAVAAALEGAPLARICITHGHSDHSGGLPALLRRWPAIEVTTAASMAAQTVERIPAGNGMLEPIGTPGHSPDHVCYADPESRDIFCGDLARLGGTIVIPARSGGDLGAYLASLERIRDLAPRRLLPGHGPIVEDPTGLIEHYLAHRAQRDRQIVEAMRQGARSVDQIVDIVYPGLSPSLRAAAGESVEAHLRALGRRAEP